MNSISFDIVKSMIHQKKYEAITEFAHVEFPDKNEVVVTEYAGTGVRVYKDNKDRTHILCPKEMDVFQEGVVATEIANGTIFDDADEVDNNAEMIEKTSIPYNAMINSGKNVPKKLKPMIAIVIGRLDDGEDTSVSDNDRITGNNFVRDLICCKDKGTTVPAVVDNYLGKDKEAFHTPEMGRDVADLDKEVSDIQDTNTEDVITDDDTVEDYGGKIPQSGDFDDYADDVDLDAAKEDIPEDTDDDDDDKSESDDDDDEEEDDEKDSDDDDDEASDEEEDDEVVKEFYEGYYDEDWVYQEGVFQTLKKIGYDPKTKTILTDIDDPNGKDGAKYRCKVVLGGPIAAAHGMCVAHSEDGKEHCIYIPLKDLMGDTDAVISSIKHEEGHISISMDRERFAKDFKNAEKLVSKYSSKLTDHGNAPEEYVADLYSARKTGDKGAGLIKKLESYDMQNREKSKKLKTKYSQEKVKKILGVIRKILCSNKKLTKEEKESVSILEEKFNDFMNDFIESTNSMIDSMCKEFKPGPGEYAAAVNAKGSKETASLANVKKSILNVKESLKGLKTTIALMRKVIAGSMAYDNFEKTFLSGYDKLCKAIDEYTKAFSFEMKARAAFVKRYVNESVTPESDDVNPNLITQFADETYQEGFLSKKPKKLKPIPRDVVAYITVEMNAIRSSNDQAMLSGYTCSKIELVDFYLTVLDTQDPRYIVPHTKQYLETMKRDLENLLTQILRIRPINRGDKIWRVNVNYPEGRM